MHGGRFLGLAFGILALSAPAFGGEPGPGGGSAPFIPDDAVQVGDSIKACSADAYARFYEHRYRTRPLPPGQEFDLMLAGLFDRSEPSRHGPPLVWLYFGPRGEIQDAVVAIPGKPVEHLTSAALLQRWPHICILIEELHR